MMILLILIAGLVVRITSLNQSFWLDEAAQATISRLPLDKINFSVDFQPPLYYVLTHYWQILGSRQEWFLRLPSVFFGLLTICVLYWFVNKLFNRNAAMVASLLLATSSYHIYYSQEYRSYSLFTLLSLLSWVFLWNKKPISYLLTVILMLYTHYFAFIIIIAQIIYILIWQYQSLKKFALMITISLISYIIWLPVLFAQFNHAKLLVNVWPKWGSLSGISFTRFPGLFFAKLTVGMISPQDKLIYLLAVMVIVAIFSLAILNIILSEMDIVTSISGIYKSIKSSRPAGIIIAAFLIPLTLLWLSSLFTNINSPHRLVFLAPIFYLILASSYYFITKSESSVFYIIASGLLIYLIIQNYYFSYSYLFNEKYQREDWRRAVLYTDNIVGNNTIAVTSYNDIWAPVYWYSNKINKYIPASQDMTVSSNNINKQTIQYKTIVYYSYLFELSDPDKNFEKFLSKNNYFLTAEKDFRGVGIIKIYDKFN